MTIQKSRRPLARMPLSGHNKPKFELGQEVWFTLPEDTLVETGRVVSRKYEGEMKYEIETKHEVWYNVPESQLTAVEKI